ncbi:MAG TPA: nuclear transport factor 2 family protein [Candidatus Limnocylindria bacterium]|nr:nuclear transport factor 2 family protein [Candidatus Limnocylindria bacterium]
MPHHITHEHVQAWLDAYVHAWESGDAADVEALFTEDAEYRYHPADEPEVGREKIVFGWLNLNGEPGRQDAPGTFHGEYRPYAVDGSRAVAVGTSTYWTDASRTTSAGIYYNNWLLEFGDDGKCRSFTEYWMVPRDS